MYGDICSTNGRLAQASRPLNSAAVAAIFVIRNLHSSLVFSHSITAPHPNDPNDPTARYCRPEIHSWVSHVPAAGSRGAWCWESKAKLERMMTRLWKPQAVLGLHNFSRDSTSCTFDLHLRRTSTGRPSRSFLSVSSTYLPVPSLIPTPPSFTRSTRQGHTNVHHTTCIRLQILLLLHPSSAPGAPCCI